MLATSLLLTRILYALTSFLYCVALIPFFEFLYGQNSVCKVETGILPFISSNYQITLFNWLNLSSSVAFGIVAVNSALLLLGISLRVTTLLQHILLSSFVVSNCQFGTAGDGLLLSISIIMLFVPQLKRSVKKDSVQADEVRARQIILCKTLTALLCIVYAASLIPRFTGQYWLLGSAVWLSLADPIAGKFAQNFAQNPSIISPLFVAVLTYLSMIYEILFIFLVWFRKYNKALVVFGILFHLCLHLYLYLGTFSLTVWILLIASLGIIPQKKPE